MSPGLGAGPHLRPTAYARSRSPPHDGRRIRRDHRSMLIHAQTTDLRATARRVGRTIAGAVHLPGDPGYDAARAPRFGSVDSHPALVVEAAGGGDVARAVAAARELELPLAVQSTGHGTHAPVDGAVLLKTSGMAHVLVDPQRRVARVGPGARWGEVIAAAAPFGLAPLAGSAPSVGVAGYTLGGGLGWLGRCFGFAADSLLRAGVVTSEGREVVAGPDAHPGLFWALRGGGGAFGVVTWLELPLYPVPEVYAGTAYFPVARAERVLLAHRERMSTAPRELSTAVLLTRLPDAGWVPEALRGRPAVALRAMYAGGPAAAERALAPLRAAAGAPLLDTLRSGPFGAAAMGGTPPRHLDLRGSLPDAVLAALLRAYRDPQSPVGTVEVRHWGGALAETGGPAGDPGIQLS